MPNRRTMLSTAGVLLSSPLGGCLGAVARGGVRADRIGDVVPDAPPDLPAVPTVSVVHAEATPERPMRIAVEWENEHPEPLGLGEGRAITFQGARSDDERAWLFRNEDGEHHGPVTFEDCWYVSGPVYRTAEYQFLTLEPGETRRVELGLYSDSADCLPSGPYRFQTDVSRSGPDEPGDASPTEEWGFELHLDRT